MLRNNRVSDIRSAFKDLKKKGHYVTDKSGVKMLEIVGASFLADEDTIFGDVNWDYVNREIQWYESQSLKVEDIPGKTPAIWEQVSSKDGRINSNYGWCIYSKDNFSQYQNVLDELTDKPNSRRAVMIYTRPSMQYDYNDNGMSDFMCTNAVQYVIRDDVLHCIVQMRSNDAWAGYRNDRAWQDHVLQQLAGDLGVEKGNIYWQVGSLHLYQHQFYLLDHFIKTGENSISKEEYRKKYPGTTI